VQISWAEQRQNLAARTWTKPVRSWGAAAHHVAGLTEARQTPPAAPDKRAPAGSRLARGSPGGVWARDIPCIDGLSLVSEVVASALLVGIRSMSRSSALVRCRPASRETAVRGEWPLTAQGNRTPTSAHKPLIESARPSSQDLGGHSVGYTTAMWLGFGEALAAVAGALTGLLFVALSVKSDVLAASRSLSSRAAETLVLFMISVLIAVLLVAPQPPVAWVRSCWRWPWSRAWPCSSWTGEPVTLPIRAWPASSNGSPPTRSPPCSSALPGSASC
jgi:hypothetical protein